MSKRGRKKKEEYYTSKKIDNVKISENSYTIYLPINIEKCLIDRNLKSQLDIISQNTFIDGYNNNSINYSTIEEKEQVRETESIKIEEDRYSKTYDISIGVEKLTHTSIHCWWCCHQFDNEPIPMPEKLIKDKYSIKGVFCSYSCCYSYMKDKNKPTWLLNYMFRDTTRLKGIMKDYVKPAPPRESLKIFGGPLDIDEFRHSDNVFTISDFPMTYVPRVLNEVINTENKNKKQTAPAKNSLAKFLNL